MTFKRVDDLVAASLRRRGRQVVLGDLDAKRWRSGRFNGIVVFLRIRNASPYSRSFWERSITAQRNYTKKYKNR